MKIALDPYMHRHLSLEELPRKVAELGYEWIELLAARRLSRLVGPPARLPGSDRELQEIPQGPRREGRVVAADVPLGEPPRG